MKKIIFATLIALSATSSFAQITIGGNGVQIGGQQQQQGNMRYDNNDYDKHGNGKGNKHGHGPSANASSRAHEVHEMKERGYNPGNGGNIQYQQQQQQQNGIVIDNNGVKLPGITIR